MKSRLNLTIDESLLKSTKLYAEKHNVSISELTEDFYKTITQPKKKENIIDLIESLGKPKVRIHGDLKELYYQDPKHGG